MAIFGLRLGANHDERIYDDSLWSREFCVKGFRCLLLVFCDFQARKQVLNHTRKRLNSSTVYSHKFLKSVSQSRNEYEADKQIVPSKTKRKQKPFFFSFFLKQEVSEEVKKQYEVKRTHRSRRVSRRWGSSSPWLQLARDETQEIF